MTTNTNISKKSAISTKNGIPPAITLAARKIAFSITKSPMTWPSAFIRLTIRKKPIQTAVIEAMNVADAGEYGNPIAV